MSAQQQGRAGRADAVQLLQDAAGGSDQLGQLPARELDLLVDYRQFDDQLENQLTSDQSNDVTRPDGVEQRAGPQGGQFNLCTCKRWRPTHRTTS
jgi:hypothetical protein